MVKFVRGRHDIGIVRADGVSNVGMMLFEREGSPLYSVFDDEFLATQFFSGTPGYASLPAEKELAIRQDSWRAGFGLDVYDTDAPERYYWSRGMDMRFRGMGIAGNAPTNVTAGLSIAIPTIADGGLETWASASNLASWTEVGGVVNVAGLQGSFAANLYGGASSVRNIAQSLTGWNNNYRNVKIRVDAHFNPVINTDVVGELRVEDGVATTAASMNGDNVWQQVTVNHTLDPAATGITIRLHARAGASGFYVTHVDNVSISIPSIDVCRSFADFNDKLYFGKGPALVRMDATNGALTIVRSFLNNITDLEPFTDDNLYIALNVANPYFYLNTSESATQSNTSLPANAYQFFKAVHSSTPSMWGSDSPNAIRKNTTPSNTASWSAQTNVGSGYHNITDLLTRSAALYIMKEDMPYYLNSSEAVQNDLAPKLQALASGTSGKNAHTDGDKIWIPAGDQSLIEEDSGVLTWRTPSLYASKITELSGRIAAVTSDDQWLYVVVNGTGVCYVLAGRTETIGTTSQWVWHAIAEVPISACETAYVSSVYQKRLWIASTTGELYYLPLFADYGNPTSDTNRSFQSNVEMVTPFLHANFKDTSKAYPKVAALLGHAYNASVFFNCYFKKLEDTSWTQLNDLVGNSTSREATSFFPSNTYSNMIRLKFVANTAYTDKTPELIGYNIQGILNPPRRNIYAMAVRVGQDIVLRDGTIDKGSQQTIIDTLDELRNAKWPVAFYDIDGTLKYVRSLPLPSGTPRMQIVMDEKSRKQERVMHLLLQEIPIS